ncbi:MAG: hypothetical protein HN337_03075 [Deltaproteobacteria bacterium]|jgi:hypothetical protein|nr:hypothetical protein [Deltaproteobacteria bacterium]
MFKNVMMVLLVAVFLVACSKSMTREQYIDAMVTMGCKSTSEAAPEGKEIMKEKGITQEDIMNYRKKMDPDKIMETITEISTKVAECHGVKLQ